MPKFTLREDLKQAEKKPILEEVVENVEEASDKTETKKPTTRKKKKLNE